MPGRLQNFFYRVFRTASTANDLIDALFANQGLSRPADIAVVVLRAVGGVTHTSCRAARENYEAACNQGFDIRESIHLIARVGTTIDLVYTPVVPIIDSGRSCDE